MVFTSLFAQTPPEDFLYAYGPLGAGVVAFAYVINKLFNIILKDRDKAIADRDAMIRDLMEKVIPALNKNTEVLETQQEVDKEIVGILRRRHDHGGSE